MKIGILGTGFMGKHLARKLASGEKFEIGTFQLLAVCELLDISYADLIERARGAAA